MNATIRADGPIPSWLERVRAMLRVQGAVDPIMAAVVVTLVAFGVVMVYSASAIEATVQYKDPQYFLKRQVSFGGVGLLLMWGISRIDYHAYKKLTYPILLTVVGLMAACVLGLGKRGGGATRWIGVGPVHIQPAELAKLALVIWLAYSLAKKGEGVKTFSVGFLPHLIMSGFLVVLCMKQPDFGSAVVLLLLTFTMLFVAGAKVGYIMGALLLGSVGAVAAVRFREYRWQRVVAWLEMEAHRQDLAYQPFQARMSFGSGGVFGLGLGKGLQILYLPEAHTDFVGAVVGEELGFVGVSALCLCYVILVARGVRAAFKAPDDYGTYLAFGLSTLFGLQALTNLAVAMSLLPTKGLTLPFISYGGSSLLVNAMAAGVLINISRHVKPGGAATSRPRGGARMILLAGGGTGGHVFPLIALAEAFAEVEPETEVRFVGTSKGLEARVVPERGWKLETLSIEPMKGRSLFGAARGGMIAGAAIVRALALVARLKPTLCVSIGGYAAGPVGVAAATLNVPLALLEPNRIAGLTQRLLKPLAKRVYVGFREAITGPKARALGIPIRKGFTPAPATAREDRPLRLFITGGSQGAQHLNETMPEVIARLIARGAALEVVHQAGRGRSEPVQKAYGDRARVIEFVEDVPAQLAWADLVVARSGALTCAELCAIGRPAVLVPYPFAADDHQAANAETLAAAGAALAIRQKDASAERLVEAIGGLYEDDIARLAMADAARARGVPDAARRIAEDVLEIMKGKR